MDKGVREMMDKGGQKKGRTGFHSGKRLNYARNLKFLTIDELAVKFKRETDTIKRWMDNRGIPKGLIPGIANYFGVDKRLFSDDHPMTEEEFEDQFSLGKTEAPPPSRKSRLALFPIQSFLQGISQYLSNPKSLKDDISGTEKEANTDLSLPYEIPQVPWDWEQVISSAHDEAEYYFWEGCKCNEESKYQQALFNLNKAIRANTLRHDLMVQAYYERGFGWYKKDNLENALQDYLKSLQTELDNLFQKLTFKWYHSNNGSESIKEFTELTETFPDRAVLYYLRGLLYFDTGDYDSAVTDFDRAIEQEPESGNIEDFHAVRGYALYQKGLYSEAINDFDYLAKEKNVIISEILFFRALAFEKEGEIRNAIQDIEKCLHTDPNHKAFLQKYNDLKKHKDTEKSIKGTGNHLMTNQ